PTRGARGRPSAGGRAADRSPPPGRPPAPRPGGGRGAASSAPLAGNQPAPVGGPAGGGRATDADGLLEPAHELVVDAAGVPGAASARPHQVAQLHGRPVAGGDAGGEPVAALRS